MDVEHTKALEQAASEGPWEVYPNRDVKGIAHIRIPLEMHPTAWTADAEFIAHARTAVPALVAAVERVQAQVDKTLEILDRYNHSDDGDLPECAPEDRWRLYRDLLATLNPEALETP